MMDYRKILTISLVPSVLLAILSLISIFLTSHYWVLTDYFVGRWMKLESQFPEKTKYPWDDVIVDYTESSTNATIVSGCLCLAASVNCIVAYFKLKPAAVDLDYHSPLRRFWVGSAIGMAFVGFVSALASLITHFTDKGPDAYGCTVTTGRTSSGSVPFSNYVCSREIAVCNFISPVVEKVGKIKGINPWAATLACNEAVAVKWLQIVLMLNAVVIMAIFGAQAGIRRKGRSPAAKGF